MPCSKPQIPTWNAEHILDLSDGWGRCNGTTLKGVRCRNPINASNRCYSTIILDKLPAVSQDPVKLQEALEALANCLLCVRWHQKDPRQWAIVIKRWQRSIHRANEKQQGQHESSPHYTPESEKSYAPRYADAETQTPQHHGQTATSDGQTVPSDNETASSDAQTAPSDGQTASSNAKAREEQLQREAERLEEQLRREAERREEAKRQSQRERERQQAEKRARAEDEARREKERDHAAREEARRREERRQRERATEEIDWEASWQQYRMRWDSFRQLPADTPLGLLIKSMPRPLPSSASGHLNPEDPKFQQDVEAFFRHMPGTDLGSVAGRTKFRRKLKVQETVRWHPDKFMQRFPHLQKEEDVHKFALSVTQVLTRVLSKLDE